ncbi:hypothetical protein ACQJBY_040007 [Aegilops geniculata]
MRVLRLVSSMIRVEQGSLTGETNSVNKTAHVAPAEDADIQAKECMVFAGTIVVNGSAICLIVRPGMATEIGKIHSGGLLSFASFLIGSHAPSAEPVVSLSLSLSLSLSHYLALQVATVAELDEISRQPPHSLQPWTLVLATDAAPPGSA